MSFSPPMEKHKVTLQLKMSKEEVLGLWRAWKADVDRRTGCFYGSQGHTCYPRVCEMVRLPLFRLPNGQLSLAPTQQEIPRTELDLLVCRVTGLPHVCGALLCSHMLDTPEGHTVCQFSGTVMDVRRVTKGRYGDVETSTPGHYVQRVESEFKAGNLLERATQLAPDMKFRHHRNKREFLGQTLVIISGLFSQKRFQMERDLQTKDYHTVKGDLDRYLGKCNALRLFPDVLKMARMVAHHRRRFSATTGFQMSEATQKNLSLNYAVLAMALWHALKTIGTTKLVLRDFVMAVVEFCQYGLTVSSMCKTYEITVIPKDPILQLFPLTRVIQRELLGSTKKNSTTRKLIRENIQVAIDSGRVDPEMFRLDTFTYDSLPEDFF